MTLHRGPGDPGDENDARVAHSDGWAHAGCVCTACVEIRTRPVGGIPTYELPDEDSLKSGLHAMAHYIKQAEHDGDYGLIEDVSLYEQRGYTLLRSACLRRATDAEAASQRLTLGGSSGVL